MLYSLHLINRRFACDPCSDTPPEFRAEFDLRNNENHVSHNDPHGETLKDIEISIAEISCKNDNINIQSFTTKVDSSVSEIKSSVSRLEFKALLVSIDSKFEVWKLDAINKIQGSSERFISDDNNDNILVSKCEHEFILKQIKAQENDISLLQSELNDKNNIINKVQNDALVLSEKMIKKNNGIDILTKELDSEKLACNKYNTEISTLKSSISNLELQINALNGQNNLLVISNNDKASLINDKQDELAMSQHRIGRCEGAKAQLELTIK